MNKPELSQLTLRERIGQTAAVHPRHINNRVNPHEYLKDNPFGIMWTAGFIKMKFANMAEEAINPDEIDYDIDKKIRQLKIDADKYMSVPFLLAADAENGVGRILPYYQDFPSAPGRAATRDTDFAYKAGKCIAKAAKTAGIYWLWGPLADNASPFNSVLNNRCFSSDPELIGKMLSATVKGMQSEGVYATLKHFPGADKYEFRDSHITDMSINDDFDTWYTRQGVTFEEGFKAGALAVMIQHSAFPAIDDSMLSGKYTPATFSHKIIQGLLKNKMGFNGVVITDAVDMCATHGLFDSKEELYAALYNAGNDVILGPVEEDYIDIIERAVEKGLISEDRINDACQRVLDMKERLGLFEGPLEPISDEERKAVKDEIDRLVERYAPNVITTITDQVGLLPMKRENVKKVGIIYLGYNQSVYRDLKYLREEFEAHGADVEIVDRLSMTNLTKFNDTCDLIIYVSHIVPHSPFGLLGYSEDKWMQLMNAFSLGRKKTIVISTGSMFVHHDWFSTANTAYSLYSASRGILKAFVKGVYGECEFTGVVPYDPNPLAPRL